MLVAWESSGEWPNALGPYTLVGDPEELLTLGSWLWIGIAPAIVLTWGVNHQFKDLSLCLSSSLCI